MVIGFQPSSGNHCGRLEPGHLENAIQDVTILLRISFKEGSQQ